MKAEKMNNRGSALVSVLVITTFISLLATTLLYMAAMNYQQKQTDYQNKQSFYGAEQSLDALRSVLVQDVESAYLTAYADTAKQFILLDSDTARQSNFQDAFHDALKKIWKERLETDGDLLTAVRTMMSDAGRAEEAAHIYKVAETGVFEVSDTDEDGNVTTGQKFVLRGVRVQYTYNHYTTFLYADICMNAPEPDWSVTVSSSADTQTERKLIAFTDYISYINWQRIDYEYEKNSEYDDLEVGTKVSDESSTEEATETE